MQPLKAFWSIFLTPSPIVACVSAVQPLKAELPSVVTLLGMLTVCSFVQPEKAVTPMAAQPSLILMAVRPIQSLNTPEFIVSSEALSSA